MLDEEWPTPGTNISSPHVLQQQTHASQAEIVPTQSPIQVSHSPSHRVAPSVGRVSDEVFVTPQGGTPEFGSENTKQAIVQDVVRALYTRSHENMIKKCLERVETECRAKLEEEYDKALEAVGLNVTRWRDQTMNRIHRLQSHLETIMETAASTAANLETLVQSARQMSVEVNAQTKKNSAQLGNTRNEIIASLEAWKQSAITEFENHGKHLRNMVNNIRYQLESKASMPAVALSKADPNVSSKQIEGSGVALQDKGKSPLSAMVSEAMGQILRSKSRAPGIAPTVVTDVSKALRGVDSGHVRQTPATMLEPEASIVPPSGSMLLVPTPTKEAPSSSQPVLTEDYNKQAQHKDSASQDDEQAEAQETDISGGRMMTRAQAKRLQQAQANVVLNANSKMMSPKLRQRQAHVLQLPTQPLYIYPMHEPSIRDDMLHRKFFDPRLTTSLLWGRQDTPDNGLSLANPKSSKVVFPSVVLYDDGATSHCFVHKDIVRALDLEIIPTTIKVSGVGGTEDYVLGEAHLVMILNLHPKLSLQNQHYSNGTFALNVKAIVVDDPFLQIAEVLVGLPFLRTIGARINFFRSRIEFYPGFHAARTLSHESHVDLVTMVNAVQKESTTSEQITVMISEGSFPLFGHVVINEDEGQHLLHNSPKGNEVCKSIGHASQPAIASQALERASPSPDTSSMLDLDTVQDLLDNMITLSDDSAIMDFMIDGLEDFEGPTSIPGSNSACSEQPRMPRLQAQVQATMATHALPSNALSNTSCIGPPAQEAPACHVRQHVRTRKLNQRKAHAPTPKQEKAVKKHGTSSHDGAEFAGCNGTLGPENDTGNPHQKGKRARPQDTDTCRVFYQSPYFDPMPVEDRQAYSFATVQTPPCMQANVVFNPATPRTKWICFGSKTGSAKARQRQVGSRSTHPDVAGMDMTPQALYASQSLAAIGALIAGSSTHEDMHDVLAHIHLDGMAY
jgi:hypothetical protein